MDDLTIAFAMECDLRELTYEQGIERAERLTDEIMGAAEDRTAALSDTKEAGS